VAFDLKEPTFRHKEFKEYQSQRPPTANELSSQFEKAKDFFRAAGVPIYSKAGFEADDVIGTIATRAAQLSVVSDRLSENSLSDIGLSVTGKLKTDKQQSENRKPRTENRDEVVIITGDRDILQLVDDKNNIKLYMPITGLTNAKFFGEKETVERMGVTPNQIPDYKALVGDPSDNYPGVAGIGPKTAIGLLDKYQNLDNVYVHIKDISPNVGKKLIDKKDDAKLFLHLATIIRDVPIKIDFEEMDKWKIDSTQVLKLFQDYGFKTLTDRIMKVGKSIEEENQGSLF
jgi:DNA polymerase-1